MRSATATIAVHLDTQKKAHEKEERKRNMNVEYVCQRLLNSSAATAVLNLNKKNMYKKKDPVRKI